MYIHISCIYIYILSVYVKLILIIIIIVVGLRTNRAILIMHESLKWIHDPIVIHRLKRCTDLIISGQPWIHLDSKFIISRQNNNNTLSVLLKVSCFPF